MKHFNLALPALLLCISVPSPPASFAALSPGDGEPTRVPEGPVPTREALVDALVEIGRERDELRTALQAAQAEISRQRLAYDALRGSWQDCESDLERSLNLGDAIMRSHATLSDLLTQERKAARRARWTEWLRIGLPSAAAGYILGEVRDE